MSGAAASSEALVGLVERVTFHNAENGFCVLRVKVRGQRDLVIVVGHAAMISAAEFVQMSGCWFNGHTHGCSSGPSSPRPVRPPRLLVPGHQDVVRLASRCKVLVITGGRGVGKIKAYAA